MNISVLNNPSVSVCACVHQDALWEGWLTNILSREAGWGDIYLLFCSWNVPRAFNNSTGSLFFFSPLLDIMPTFTTSGLNICSLSLTWIIMTEVSHISGMLFTFVYDCACVWSASLWILTHLWMALNMAFHRECVIVSFIENMPRNTCKLHLTTKLPKLSCFLKSLLCYLFVFLVLSLHIKKHKHLNLETLLTWRAVASYQSSSGLKDVVVPKP